VGPASASRWLLAGPSVAEIGGAGVLIQTGGSMKFSIAKTVGTACALASGVSFAQNGNMMNGGGMWGTGWMGGYGGFWMPALLILVVGVVVWAILQKRK
jgi:hypothetical protein